MRRFMMLMVMAACSSEAAIAPPRDRPTSSEEVETPPAKAPTPSKPENPKPSEAPPYAVSNGKSVLWKRYAAFERDLMRGLGLSRDEVCKELGDRECIRDIHLIALGGNDPFGSGIHRPPPWTLGTTPIVVDRVLLSACTAAANKGSPVFAGLDLAGPPPALADATTTSLFRALLARDPKPAELSTVAQLLEPGEDAPTTAKEFAVLACFVVGSSLEFLFQ